jgi:23S rRNA (guanosine2251-2'-O)-methyltransferase
MMQKLSMDQLERKQPEEFRKSDKLPIVVVLDNVRSMHNVGSIFRTADAFLLESIYLCGYTPRPPHRDIQKTALGATETVTWKAFDDIREALQELRQNDYQLLAAEQTTESLPLHQAQFERGERLAIIFGNEVEGVQQEVIDECSMCIEIPQLGTKHSLNVSVAAGVVLWKLIEAYL